MAKNAKSTNKQLKIDDKTTNETFFYDEERDKVIVSYIENEYERRRQERRPFDASWELNINFLLGNQYAYISESGEIQKSPKMFYWQGEEVFNHIAPIIETRLAKLGKVRPNVIVRPSGSEERDEYCAKLSKTILSVFANRVGLKHAIEDVTVWSEVCGSGFYKVVWGNSGSGNFACRKQTDVADAVLSVVSPFEIFPDSCFIKNINEQKSIIHARLVPSKTVFDIYGVEVCGSDLESYSFDTISSSVTYYGKTNSNRVAKSVLHDHVLLLEYFEMPSSSYPCGKMSVVASGKLLYDGDLPYIDARGNYFYPFVKQDAISTVGCFWGTSVIERCIPIQRAYNAIKNRKHEYLSRLAAGVLAVEDGSIDTDDLEIDGLAPGKIIVYRSGSVPPKFMDAGSVPNDFSYEEDRLLNEFVTVSGVSEFMRDSVVPSGVSSGTALSLIIEQDETRLAVTAESIRQGVLELAEKVISLYKQFASNKRLSKIVDDGGNIELYYWDNSDISYEDIVLESSNELSQSPAQRKNMLFELFRAGLFNDENGQISKRTKQKILEGLGFNSFDSIQDITPLHIKKADEENINVKTQKIAVSEIDDHDIHILEHTKFLLSSSAKELDDKLIQAIKAHILEHKMFMSADKNIEKGIE